MSEQVSVDFSLPIPVFPLPGTVLLPHAALPLHIFEPRYRQMTADVLEGARLIAMASLDRAGAGSEPPLLRPHVCLGRIVQEHRYSDGRYHILLQGLCRARILDEPPHEPYRVALLEPTELEPPDDLDLGPQRSRIEHLLGDESLAELAVVSQIKQMFRGYVPAAALVDLTAMTVCMDPEQRYAMLAEPNAARRAAWVISHLEGLQRTMHSAQRLFPGDPEGFVTLN